MIKSVRIGSGSRTFDRINIIIDLCIVFGLTLLTIFQKDMVYMLVIIFLIIGINLVNILMRNYISYRNGFFIIEHVVKETRIREATLYKRVLQSHFAFPFANVMILHLKNGESFRFQGGRKSFQTIDSKVKHLIQGDSDENNFQRSAD